MGVTGSPRCESAGDFQALLCARKNHKTAPWGCQIQWGSSSRSPMILESLLRNHLWVAAPSRLPCSLPLFYREVWGRRVVFRVCVNSQSWAGSWNINRPSIYKRVWGAVRSLGNPHLAFWLTCDCTVQHNKRLVERAFPTSSRLWKEQGPAVKRPCRIILPNWEIYPIFSVLYQSGRQKRCGCRLKDRHLKSNLTDMGFWNLLPNPSDVSGTSWRAELNLHRGLNQQTVDQKRTLFEASWEERCESWNERELKRRKGWFLEWYFALQQSLYLNDRNAINFV